MWLSTKDFKRWEMAVSENDFGAGYQIPVRGIFIPAPDVIFDGLPVGEMVYASMIPILRRLDFDLVVNKAGSVMHLAMGERPICMDCEMERLGEISAQADICMLCQYLFWMEKVRVVNRRVI